MANREAPSKRYNKSSKEVAIDGKFDTAGFLYSPYRADFDEKTKTLRLTDNTLRDIIRDELLSRAVTWLLGYDARYPLDDQIDDTPIRAQAEGSHWETAWCLILFLDAWPILADKHPSLASEIDRRLSSNDPTVSPLVWLLTEAIDRGEGQVCWYGKEYDTALVTMALMRVRAEKRLELSIQLKMRLTQLLYGALRWLYNHLEHALETGKVDEEATIVLEPLIYAKGYSVSLFSEVWPESNTSEQEKFHSTLDKWLTYLEARLAPHKENSQTSLGLGAIEAYCLCRLAFMGQDVNLHLEEHFRSFTERAKVLLLHYIEFLEEWLEKDQWGGNLNRVWRLGTYVEACASVAGNQSQSARAAIDVSVTSAEVVLKVLSMVKNEFFSNGSIFHSVYPTVYFLRSLISVWNWPEAKKTIAQLYHDLLDKFVIRLSVERKESFELGRLLIERERELTNEKERYRALLRRESKKRYVLLGLVFTSITVAILVYVSNVLKLSDLIQFAGVEIAALAIILVVIEVIFLRES